MIKSFHLFPRKLSMWLGRKLNKRVKRYILLTSLWSHLNEYKREAIDKETLKKLNLVMRLASDSDSLYIPALLGKVIWKDSLGNTTQIKDLPHDIEQIAKDEKFFEKILNNIPSWLNYDKRDVIEKEIHHLVEKLPIVNYSL